MSIKTLGKYQWEWLNKYGRINLIEWRYEYIYSKVVGLDWYYVGYWKPSNVEPYPSKKDGGYEERRINLKKNPYFYWPPNT
jgi:hypothetical protein